MFDHFRADHAVEGGVLEGQLEDRAVDQRVAVPPRIAELGENDVEPHHPRETDDATRPAADIEHAARAGGHRRDHLVAPALPVTLQWHDAGIGAGIVVGRGDRVAQFPHGEEGLQVREGKACQPGTAGAERAVAEWHLADLVPGGDHADQDLLEEVKTRRVEFESRDRLPPVEAVTAGQVRVGEGEATAQDATQRPAQRLPRARHLGGPTGDVARGDHHVDVVARRPDRRQKAGVVGAVRVERQDVLSARLLEPDAQRRAVARPRRLEDLVADLEGAQLALQGGEEAIQVARLPGGRDHDGQVVCVPSPPARELVGDGWGGGGDERRDPVQDRVHRRTSLAAEARLAVRPEIPPAGRAGEPGDGVHCVMLPAGGGGRSSLH